MYDITSNELLFQNTNDTFHQSELGVYNYNLIVYDKEWAILIKVPEEVTIQGAIFTTLVYLIIFILIVTIVVKVM